MQIGPEDKRWIDTLPTAAFDGGVPCVSAPRKRPSHVYPETRELDPNLFEIPATGLTSEQHAEALRQAKRYHDEQKERFLGFQANQSFPHLTGLEEYLQCQLNNLGDPFGPGNFTLNTKWLERSVLDYYASLWNARWPHDPKDPESYWGYVLSMGSTEGNLYGLWNAREYLSGRALMEVPHSEEEDRQASLEGPPRRARQSLVFGRPVLPPNNLNMFTPVIFFSKDTHYSIHKAVRALQIKTFSQIGNYRFPGENPLAPGKPWPKEVPSKDGGVGPGSVDIEALAKLVDFFASHGYPILVFFNYGTTFKGAYDDVEKAGNALMPIFQAYGLMERPVIPEGGRTKAAEIRNGFWFHVDGALGAAYMPFLEMAKNAGRIEHRGPNFDFRLPFIHSLVMSGHKWIGAPWPCGIFMTKTKLQMKPPDVPEYVGSPDTTFAGSRNGFSALLLWNYAATNSYAAQIERALATEKLAVYASDRLHELEVRLEEDLWVARTSPCSLTIRFKAASPRIQHKYSLSGETLEVGGLKRKYSHIFIMPHVTQKMIDDLVADLVGEMPEQPEALPPSAFEHSVDGPLPPLSEKLREILGEEVWIDWGRSSIHFPSPGPEIASRYNLKVENFFVRGRKRSYASLGNAGDLPVETVEELLRDLRQPGAFEGAQAGEPEIEKVGAEIEHRSYFYVAHQGRGFR